MLNILKQLYLEIRIVFFNGFLIIDNIFVMKKEIYKFRIYNGCDNRIGESKII